MFVRGSSSPAATAPGSRRLGSRGRPLVPLALALFMAAAALGAAAATAAGVIEVPLKFIRYSDGKPAGFMPMGMSSIQFSDQAPPGIKLPKFVSDKPAFGAITIGARKISLALDLSDKSDKFYKRLFIDQNGNNDLSDDPPITRPSSGTAVAIFQAVDLKLNAGGKSLPYSLTIEAYNSAAVTVIPTNPAAAKIVLDPKLLRGYVNLNCGYTGEFEADGKHYRVALGDMNGNGTFDDCHSAAEPGKVAATSGGKQVVYKEGDAFMLTDRPAFDADDLLVLGNFLVLGPTTYRTRVDVAAGRLTLTPVTEGLVPLNIPAHTAGLEIVSADKKTSIMLIDPAASVRVPAGRYSMFKYMITRQDEQGDTWRAVAQAAAMGQNAPEFTVDAASATSLSYGEPFLVKAIPPQRMSGASAPKSVYLSLSITDPMGMDVRGVTHVDGNRTKIAISKDKSHPLEPTYEIKTAAGDKVASGQFEYG